MIEVEAKNEEQALEKAMNEFNMDFAELDDITEMKVDEA